MHSGPIKRIKAIRAYINNVDVNIYAIGNTYIRCKGRLVIMLDFIKVTAGMNLMSICQTIKDGACSLIKKKRNRDKKIGQLQIGTRIKMYVQALSAH